MSPVAGTRHLYVHVPFCAHRCGYCDFVTVTGHEDERARYVDAVIAEIDRAGLEPETVFVGGGTPSILADDRPVPPARRASLRRPRSRSSATPRRSRRPRLECWSRVA